MGSNWRAARLGDHVEMLFGRAFKSAGFTTETEAVRLVRGDNITEGQLRWGEKTRRWPCVTPELDRYLLREGDVVIGMDGSKVGRNWARIRSSDLPLLLVQRVARLRPRDSLVSGYIPLLVGSPAFRRHVDAVKTGSSIPHISGNQIGEFEFLLPPLVEQEAISTVLGALDDKIELNQRMSETLDALASALFHGWFIDKVGLPEWAVAESWTEVPLQDLVIEHKKKVDPPQTPDALFEHYSLPAFDTGDGPARDVGRSIKSAKTRVPVGAILVSRLNPRIPRVWLCDVESPELAIASTEFLVLTPKPAVGRAFTYLTATSPAFQQKLISMATGTSGSHQRVRPGAALGVRVVRPEAAVLVAFGAAVEPLLDRRLNAGRQNRVLRLLRDTLLPKLINGELRIPDAERLVSEVT